RVGVALLGGEGEEDLELDGTQGKERGGIGRLHDVRAEYMLHAYMCQAGRREPAIPDAAGKPTRNAGRNDESRPTPLASRRPPSGRPGAARAAGSSPAWAGA